MTATPRVGRDPIVRIEAEGGQRVSDLDRRLVAEAIRERGVALIGGFDATLEEFVRLTERLGTGWSDHRGGGARLGALDPASVDLAATAMAAAGRSRELPVPLPGELSSLRPRLLCLWCETVSPEGDGETAICDGADLLAALPEATRRFLTDTGIVFHRRLVGEEWRRSFMTDDVEEVRRICAVNATEVAYDPADDIVRTAYRCSAVVPSPDGRPAFVSSLLPVHHAEMAQRSRWAAEAPEGSRSRVPSMTVRTVEGREIPEGVIGDLTATAAAMETVVTWRGGDIVVVDNARVLHRRAPSTSPEHTVHVRMGEPRFAV